MPSFTQVAAFVAAAVSLVSANSMTFINQDGTTRRIVFTPDYGHAAIDSITLPGNAQARAEFPTGWIGNAYSVSEGKEDVPGMLAEVAYQGWDGLTYFDVSAIVNAADHDGVKQMFPASQLSVEPKTVFSGCLVFPCGTAYYLPDDIQTVTTPETDIIVTLGSSPNDVVAREEPRMVPRHYVLGNLSA
ncbi:hypothetical protein GGS23DRAFT_592583 [Durotheca rogersii]|uniref:uncharacterized protein n=1 Tax=Durotheca rogersii TaxID=419775 RepID=UPI00221EB5D1|nr:uncharacterized protein GGS23DRAFT_592583 [Durotheca rogersii]KAI5867250.1 hypothetical protein GGS23DRAFT_592583 [Durotheca rogersii]